MLQKNVYRIILLFVAVLIIATPFKNLQASPPAKNSGYFQFRIYHYSNSEQEAVIDQYLKNNFIPALHADNINNIGVFKALANDTSINKRMYVFIPFKSLKQWEKFLKSNHNKIDAGSEYINAAYDKPVYNRIESIFLKSFMYSPIPAAPKLNNAKSERVYELRSYESASEKIHENKVQMFNEGGETVIFSRLNFNPVFYGQVVAGSKMPNLMYLTCFENMNDRTEHWKNFASDTAWKKLSASSGYQHNVSKNEIVFLRPAEYSDL